MRSTISSLIIFGICLLFTQCSGQTKPAVEAQKLANKIEEKTAVPGEAPSAGMYMKAVIDGKPWTATKLVRDESRGSNNYRVTGTGNETTIGFYVYIPHLKVGDVTKFYESHVADFITNDDQVFYGGRTGRFVVTKVDQDGFEGNFSFTATSSGVSKKFEVTEGSLRFPWAR
ncbi:MAG TPA: hypothetical protein VL307_16760 [Chitinophagaceae bacterium]|nr:hypothetical protein [Chitinophagaceae bacterium]